MGRILRIEKTSIHDGDGLRTVVFMKGCPMRCLWCSTPESQSAEIEHGYGKDMTVSEVMDEISKDEIFYFHSGGGMTISGGEALLQIDFTKNLLMECRNRGINTAIETSLYAGMDELLPYLNSIYIDIKHMDEKKHRELCGVSNKQILENIKKLSNCYHGELHIRVPIIPTLNDDEKNLIETALFCDSLNIKDIELLPYHRLGLDTYRKIGKPYKLGHIETPTQEDLRNRADIIARAAPQLKVMQS